MAPTAKPKVVPEGFLASQDGKKVQCTLCTALSPQENWMAWASISNHIKSAAHKRAIEQNQAARTRSAVIQKERETDHTQRREAELQFSNLQGVQIPDPHRISRVQTATETELWEQLEMDPHAAGFDLGVDKTTQQYNSLCDEMKGLWNAGIMGRDSGFALGEGNDPQELLQEDEEEDFLSEIMANAGELLYLSSRNGPVTGPEEQSAEWSPYPSKMLFLLDTLDNLPRLRISNSLMKVFLWILKESGAREVPSFDHLRKIQKNLREKCGVPTTQYKTVTGNIFHMNDPRTLIAKDWANPETRKFIHVYPEIPEDGVIREIWHAQKWRKDMDLDLLSPMYDARHLHTHFFVNELARLKSGQLVIPIRWLKFRDRVCADAFAVDIDSSGVATVRDEHTILISAEDLVANFLDLEDESSVPKWSDETIEKGHPERMPNPKRALAGGHPIYSCFVDIFGDDVSGNRSKSWNKHWNTYMTHRNLPRSLLQQEYHVHFISTSPNATIPEQYTAFKSVIEKTHEEPMKVRDSETEETVCLSIYANAGPSDNPMQSEISGHIGAKGNFFCRKCHVGGSDKDKESNECFHSLFEPGIPRSKEKILTELKKQVEMACSGVAQPIKNAQKDTGIKDAYTQHWIDHLLEQFKQKKQADPERSTTEIQEELIQWTLDNEDKIYNGFLTTKGFDPTKDTPVEILHTILLGVVKYIWHSSHTSWTPAQKQTYSLRLQATNTDGLSIHPIRAPYIMQYANSLIGRQFKTIVQVSVFHVHDILTPELFAVWRAVGEFAALIWVPEIRNLDEYLKDVQIAAGNVMDAFAVVDPTKILSKIKLHLLSHCPEDIIAFGPLLGVITEIFECFNGVFRVCSVLSNHLAPSRDIALQLADQEGLKHRLTGGWWPTLQGEWERAGPGVRTFLETRPVLQRLVGWTIYNPPIPGTVKLVSLPKRQKGVPKPIRSSVVMGSTHASQALNAGNYDLSSSWFPCHQVISASLDECNNGSWVFAKSPITGDLITGRINAILEDGNGVAVIILDVFHVTDSRHDIFGMPVLVRRQSETTFLIVPALDIRFLYNVQHDCKFAGCEATGEKPRMQERVDSGLTDRFIVHKSAERFVINTHAFHNAHLLRQVLPRQLTAPTPLFKDRTAKHYELAANLREIKNGKRKRAAEKREAKKQAKADAETAPPDSDIEERENSEDDEEEESRPRKKQRRRTRKRQVDAEIDSDSEWDGGRVEAGQIEVPRTSGRARRPTQRAQDADYGSDAD
ncbi:hypothetical protein B0H11DRAFT_1727263 [Mycena galericulata]|nr:hypothetical protein B0H11DRAFT_1727263 [Mycena galericulata]